MSVVQWRLVLGVSISGGKVTLWGEAKIDWDDMRELIADAYRLVAPKRILRQMT
jgi:hypothetical protein